MNARRIDVHCHLNPPFYQEAVIANRGMPQIGRFPDSTVPTVLDLMDNNEIEFSMPGCNLSRRAFYAARSGARHCATVQ